MQQSEFAGFCRAYKYLKPVNKKLLFWVKKRNFIITFLAVIGFIYQFSTLAIMIANDAKSANNIRLWNGFFPWWTVLFTFTFWSNFLLLLTYFFYLFFIKAHWLKQDNALLFSVNCYITLVFLVVAFALLPAAVITKSNVNFKTHTSALTYAALIMPHGPGPLFCIFFSCLVFSLNREGNHRILHYSYGRLLFYISVFFVLYLCMDVILNWIPTGTYYLNPQGQKIYFVGYTVYSFFTNLNVHLPNVVAGHIVSYGSSLNIFWYFLGILILVFTYTIYWILIRFHFASYWKFVLVSVIKIH